jgi:hypothetical protein
MRYWPRFLETLTAWVQSDMSVTEFGTLFACEDGSDGFAAEAETGLLRCRRCRRMRTVPHFILYEKVPVDGSTMFIVSGWSN